MSDGGLLNFISISLTLAQRLMGAKSVPSNFVMEAIACIPSNFATEAIA